MREFDLLQHIYAASGPPRTGVPIGPGDDMAMIECGGGLILAGVDQVVEGRHFEPDTSPRLIGRKSVTRSLSDVAAMAGRPLAALASATLPPDFGEKRAVELFDAMHETGARYDCPLVGGDIAFAGEPGSPLVCSVTVLAEPGPGGAVTRSGARVADGVYVTGRLGGSLRSGRHLTFEPRLSEALELAGALGERLHAMIDISDGLGRDASHIATCSGVAIELEAGHIPAAEGLDWRRAVSDGEDYELLFTAAGKVPSRLGKVAVTAVGRVVAVTGSPAVTVRDGSRVVDVSELGWEHRS